jgi:hypothetical protein
MFTLAFGFAAPTTPASLTHAPVLTPSPDATGYWFSVPFTDGSRRHSWPIRQDRRLTLETPH